ncbi:AGE family epimerase/isomerase, partial [Burkholderia multivorans]
MNMPPVQPCPATPAAHAQPAPFVANFRDPSFLLSHVEDTLRFYAPNVLDPTGGFYHYFRD